MKKFLSLTVALAMTVAMVPATAFAKSDMKVSRIITAESDDILFDGSTYGTGSNTVDTRVAPYLTLTVDGNFKERVQTFRLKLTNAEWLDEGGKEFEDEGAAKITVKNAAGADLIDQTTAPSNDPKKDLQDKLNDLAKPAESGTTVSKATLMETIEFLVAKGTIDKNTTAGDTATALKDAMSSDVKDLIDGGTGVTEWGNIGTAVSKLVIAQDAAKTAEDALDADAVKAYNDAIGAYNALVLAAADGTTVTAAQIEAAYAAAKTADKTGAVTDWVDDVIADAELFTSAVSTATLGTALNAYFTLVENVETTKADVAIKEKVVDQALEAFNKVDGGTAAVKLDAQDVLDKYKAVNKNRLAFFDYLATDGKITATADQEAVLALVKAWDEGTSITPPSTGKGSVTVERVTDTLAMVTIETTSPLPDDAEVIIPLYTKLTGGETATVEVDPRDSEFSSDSKTFAKISEGSTEAYIDGTKNFYDGDTMKTVYIDEVSANTFEAGKDIKIKLSSGFKWGVSESVLQSAEGSRYISIYNSDTLAIDYSTMKVDGDEITFRLTDGPSKNPATIKFANLTVKEDGADFGTTARVTVSGAGITKKTIEIGTYADFGLTLTAESKALPVIYSGSFDDDNETLKVTFEETVQNSWIPTRKTVFSLPEGVKFVDVEVKKTENFSMVNDAAGKELEVVMQENIDGNEITIPANAVDVNDGKKAKFEAIFTITADPEFTGDVELKVSGPGVGNEELSKVIATVNAPLTVTSSVNEVKIDYRNVAVNSITITEAEAGLWEKGDIIALEVEEMQFESGIKAEIVSGDMKLEKLDGDNVEVDKKEGILKIKVKSTSSSTPAEIKIDGIQLYLNRSLPAGDYKLSVVATKEEIPADGRKDKDLLFANFYKERSKTASGGEWDTDSYGFTSFETDSVTVLEDFVKVVTAGRDQDDSTFTTKIVVPVGSDKIMAGTTEITIDSPAYINADGYTMLPVRAVIDALNGVAVVRWDDATKTCTISFGSRIFAMTVGSKTMNMNGVATALLAAPEIRNERIFLPLRDLGYALGLTDSKINWDSATNTATLN